MLILPMVLVVTLGKGCMSSFQTLAEKRTTFGSAMSTDEDRINKKKVLPSELGESREIAVIDIKGVILYENNFNNASARRIAAELRAAREDDNVVAILLDMDTPGGEVVASDEILNQVRACRDAGKPVVTCMRSMGASGGYFIASGSDWIRFVISRPKALARWSARARSSWVASSFTSTLATWVSFRRYSSPTSRTARRGAAAGANHSA